jgi:hypothetical protein
MSRSLVILILGLTPLTGAAQAIRRGGDPDEIWKALASKHDADGDGRIDLSEYPRGEERFRALDRNGDGGLTSDDFRIARKLDPRKRAKLRLASEAPQVGQMAPDFELPFAKNETETVRLSSFRDKRPVALVFGSYT